MELWGILKESHSSSPEKDFLRDVGRNLTDRLVQPSSSKDCDAKGRSNFPSVSQKPLEGAGFLSPN